MRRLGWFFNDDFNPDPMSDLKAWTIIFAIILVIILVII